MAKEVEYTIPLTEEDLERIQNSLSGSINVLYTLINSPSNAYSEHREQQIEKLEEYKQTHFKVSFQLLFIRNATNKNSN